MANCRVAAVVRNLIITVRCCTASGFHTHDDIALNVVEYFIILFTCNIRLIRKVRSGCGFRLFPSFNGLRCLPQAGSLRLHDSPKTGSVSPFMPRVRFFCLAYFTASLYTTGIIDKLTVSVSLTVFHTFPSALWSDR